MLRPLLLLLVTSILTVFAPRPADAQAQVPDWRPPGRAMPSMPAVGGMDAGWMGAQGGWFSGIEAVSGVRAADLRGVGEPRPGSDVAQIARFNNGPLPVVVWSDRNGDGRADLIEIFRQGGVIIQVIDADYDGSANVLRVYDVSGKLLREERL